MASVGVPPAAEDGAARALTRRHSVPNLGHFVLGKLSRDDVRRLIRQLQRTRSPRRGEDKRLSPRTAQHVHSILRRALEDARREELIGRNVARDVTPPKVVGCASARFGAGSTLPYVEPHGARSRPVALVGLASDIVGREWMRPEL